MIMQQLQAWGPESGASLPMPHHVIVDLFPAVTLCLYALLSTATFARELIAPADFKILRVHGTFHDAFPVSR